MANETNYNPCRLKGNGATLNFPFNWCFIENTDIVVSIEDSTGEQTIQTLMEDYAINVYEGGGEVVFKTAPADDEYVIISRKTSNLQKTRYSTSTGFQGSEIEKSFDRVSCCLQDMVHVEDVFKTELQQNLDSFKTDIQQDFDDYTEEIDSKLDKVNAAADKINALDAAVEQAQASAATASEKALDAQHSAEEVAAQSEFIKTQYADKNLSNLSEAGKDVIKTTYAGVFGEALATKTDKQQAAKASMPSNTVVELTLGATNSTHIAPANGYMSFSASTTAVGGYVGLTRDDSNIIPEIAGLSYSPTNGKAVSVTIPVKMGDTVRSTYSNVSNTHLRFVNAEGDQ